MKGKKMIRKISDMVGEVSKEIKRLEKELWLFQNSNDWVDWLDQMYLEIEGVQDYSLEEKQKFLKEYLNRIDVEYKPEIQSHQFHFEFVYPIVQDDILKKGKTTDGKRDYEVVDGSKTSTYTFKLGKDYKKKISIDKERELQELINELRFNQSLSLNEVSKELNQKGYRTVTNKFWNKSNLSLHIKRMGVGVGK